MVDHGLWITVTSYRKLGQFAGFCVHNKLMVWGLTLLIFFVLTLTSILLKFT